MGRCGYCCLAYGFADYIRYLGAWDIHPLSGNPNKMNNYFALVMPFDEYIWYFLIASIITVYVTMVVMDKGYDSWKPGWKSSHSSKA